MSQPFEILYKSMKENMSTSPFSLSLGDQEHEQSCCLPTMSSGRRIYVITGQLLNVLGHDDRVCAQVG